VATPFGLGHGVGYPFTAPRFGACHYPKLSLGHGKL